MGLAARLLAEVATATAKAQNVDLFAADFQTSRGDSIVRITYCDEAAIDIKLVANDDVVLVIEDTTTADTPFTVELCLDTTRTWNIQTGNAAGLSCTLCVVQEIFTN
jgi:hypothetical protein